MKTAISIPDNIFSAAENEAKKLNIARSQLYTKALEEYLSNHNNQNVLEKLNSVYSKNTETEISNINIQSLREATKNDSW